MSLRPSRLNIEPRWDLCSPRVICTRSGWHHERHPATHWNVLVSKYANTRTEMRVRLVKLGSIIWCGITVQPDQRTSSASPQPRNPPPLFAPQLPVVVSPDRAVDQIHPLRHLPRDVATVRPGQVEQDRHDYAP